MRLLLWSACALVVTACGYPSDDKSQEAVLNVTISDFERSSFYRRHPTTARQNSPGQVLYRFGDRYSDSKTIEVALDLEGDRVSAFTVKWVGDISSPAVWSSVKKQFIADLLEATFWDVDYGQVSTYVMGSGEKTYSASEPAERLGPARIRAGNYGSDFVLRIER